MAKSTFSMLPTEIHISIANQCAKSDLVNLCCTSKWLNKRCLHVLYRDVNLRVCQCSTCKGWDWKDSAANKQWRFVRALLSHPEYGRYVKYLGATLCIPSLDERYHISKDMVSDKEFWRAILSLTHVKVVNLGSLNRFANCMTVPTKQFPSNLFQSATSVKLVGHMQYGLAKVILNAINPATLKHLCLDLVQDYKVGIFQSDYVAGNRGEDGQLIALGATSGLLRTLTGRCTALKTLILRRFGQIRDDSPRRWHTPAEEACYVEWTAFIRSVQGTVETCTFDQVSGMGIGCDEESSDGTFPIRIMDKRFRRLVHPTLISGKWPCLTLLELGGVRYSTDLDRMAALIKELQVAVGDNVKLLVAEKACMQKRYDWPSVRENSLFEARH